MAGESKRGREWDRRIVRAIINGAETKMIAAYWGVSVDTITSRLRRLGVHWPRRENQKIAQKCLAEDFRPSG